jgi:hypothetical protein
MATGLETEAHVIEGMHISIHTVIGSKLMNSKGSDSFYHSL